MYNSFQNNYNNRFNRGGYNNQQGGYNNGYQRSYNNGYQRNHQPQQKKHSGCTYRENVTTRSGKKKEAVAFGWNYSRQRGGLVKFVAVPAKDTTVNNKSGKNLAKWVAKVQFPNGQSVTMTCFRNRDTNKLIFPDLSMVASFNAPNGGYWGRAFRK